MSKRDWIKCARIWQNTGNMFSPALWMDAGLKISHVNECLHAFDDEVDSDSEYGAFHTSAQMAQLCCEKAGIA